MIRSKQTETLPQKSCLSPVVYSVCDTFYRNRHGSCSETLVWKQKGETPDLSMTHPLSLVWDALFRHTMQTWLKDLLLFCHLFDRRWRVFGLWAVGWTKTYSKYITYDSGNKVFGEEHIYYMYWLSGIKLAFVLKKWSNILVFSTH